IRELPRRGADPPAVEVLRQRAHRAELQIARKDRADHFCLGWHHYDLLVHRRIAERDRTPDPNTLALGGGDLVPHPLPDELPLERGAGECTGIVAAWNQPPALVRLALDIGLTGLALGIERAEGKVEVMLARLAGIDRAARELADGAVHATEPITHRGNGSSRRWVLWAASCRATPCRRP